MCQASKLYFDFYVEVVMASLPGQTKDIPFTKLPLPPCKLVGGGVLQVCGWPKQAASESFGAHARDLDANSALPVFNRAHRAASIPETFATGLLEM